MENDSSTSIQSMDEIPLGHKIAMIDLNEGDTILTMKDITPVRLIKNEFYNNIAEMY